MTIADRVAVVILVALVALGLERVLAWLLELGALLARATRRAWLRRAETPRPTEPKPEAPRQTTAEVTEHQTRYYLADMGRMRIERWH